MQASPLGPQPCQFCDQADTAALQRLQVGAGARILELH